MDEKAPGRSVQCVFLKNTSFLRGLQQPGRCRVPCASVRFFECALEFAIRSTHFAGTCFIIVSHMMLRKAAPAKINLGLHVLRKRSDGYHDIETVFLQIGWADEVSVEPPAGRREAGAPAFSGPLHVTPVGNASPADLLFQVPPGSGNLVYRAAQCLDPHKGARIELRKRIPVGAGLGGGSSDAATALRLLNDLWGLARSREELIRMAASVGADAAFFAAGDAAAFGAGRGDVLKPLMGDGTPYVFPYPLVVAAPPVQVSTAGAYALVQPNDRNRPDLCEVLLSGDPERWRAELTNDFERVILPRYPQIAAAKTALEEAGAVYASLSGSGSAVYGAFENEAQAEEAEDVLRRSGCLTWRGRVCTSGSI